MIFELPFKQHVRTHRKLWTVTCIVLLIILLLIAITFQLENVSNDNVKVIVGVITSFVGLGYPIMIQVISRLDDKYSSIHIVKLFNSEKLKKSFLFTLYVSLSVVIVWVLNFTPPNVFENDPIVGNSANLLVLTSGIFLVVLFFALINLVLNYYTPEKFVKYLMRQCNMRDLAIDPNNQDNALYYNALMDVFLHSIKNQNHNLCKFIIEYFSTLFAKTRKHFTIENAEFPHYYYVLTNKVIEEYANLKSKRDRLLESGFASNAFLLGWGTDPISPRTYSAIWSNLNLMVENESSILIYEHWQNASRYYMHMEVIELDYDWQSDDNKPKNLAAYNESLERREYFMRFHYALGGLLIYKSQLPLIRKFFTYTTSIPYSFDLLPTNLSEIFKIYNDFRNRYTSHESIAENFRFYDQDGFYAEAVTRKYVTLYCCILYLRQYTLPSHYSYNPLQLTNFPETLHDLKQWSQNLPYFQDRLKEVLLDDILLKDLQLQDLKSKEFFKNSKQPWPLELLKEIGKQIDAEYERQKSNREIDQEKVQQFFNASGAILNRVVEKLLNAANPNAESIEYNKYAIGGEKTLADRDSFVEESEVSHINADSFLANHLAASILNAFAATFYQSKTSTLTIKRSDFLDVIKRLKITKEYTFIQFGNQIIDQLPPELQDVPVLTFNQYYPFRGSIFIVKKADLPVISLPATDKDEGLQRISQAHNIYARFNDLKGKEIAEIEELNVDHDLDHRNFVFLEINVTVEIRWKKELTLLQLLLADSPDTILSDLNDIVPL